MAGSSGRERDRRPRRAGRPPTGRRGSEGRKPQEGGSDLPRWVAEGLTRVTPAARVPGALQALGEAAAALEEGRFKAAMRRARDAKELAPRDPTVREVLGLAAYRAGDWRVALGELRTYRRLTGDTTHLPVEMDALRGLGRSRDVEKAWEQFGRLESSPATEKEGRVVYASFLMDEGRVDEARRLVRPRVLFNDPFPEDLRLWYVAARAAALAGDVEEAVRLRDAVLTMDPAFPGIDELDVTISSHADEGAR